VVPAFLTGVAVNVIGKPLQMVVAVEVMFTAEVMVDTALMFNGVAVAGLFTRQAAVELEVMVTVTVEFVLMVAV
jgi:hypothetical protein